MTIHLQRMENDEHFRKAFTFFDKDGSGYIELSELEEALADDLGETDTDVLNDIMREVDTDKVWLSFSRFIALFSFLLVLLSFLVTMPLQHKQKQMC